MTTGPDGERHPLAKEEEHLIAAARHDPRAFAPLYEAYVDLVWRYAMSRLGDRERALDATSLVFSRALAALPRFHLPRDGAGGAFRAWLMTIARNVVLDDLRRHRPADSLDDLEGDRWIMDLRYLPEDLALASETTRELLDAIRQLAPVQQRIVRLRLIGMTSAEIADILQMRVPAVDTAHFRAITRLRRLLAREITS